MSSSDKCLFSYSANFLIEVFFFFNFGVIKCHKLFVNFFETNPLLVTSFANVFSQSVGYLFILFIDSFAVQNFSIYVGPICYFVLLFPLIWGDGLKKILL